MRKDSIVVDGIYEVVTADRVKVTARYLGLERFGTGQVRFILCSMLDDSTVEVYSVRDFLRRLDKVPTDPPPTTPTPTLRIKAKVKQDQAWRRGGYICPHCSEIHVSDDTVLWCGIGKMIVTGQK